MTSIDLNLLLVLHTVLAERTSRVPPTDCT